MIRSGQLKIERPCPGDADIDRARGHCHTCSKSVHNLSQMTEPEVEKLLRREGGGDLCVSYRVDGRGEPIFKARPAPPRLAGVPMVVMSLALAACAPWGLEEFASEAPGQDGGECVLVDEGEWECVDDFEMPVVEPEEPESCAGGEEAAGEWSVPGEYTVAGGIGVQDVLEAPQALPAPPSLPERGFVATVNFDIETESDADLNLIVGLMGPDEAEHGQRLEFTPTADLIASWKGRRAQKKAQREVRRARKRAKRELED